MTRIRFRFRRPDGQTEDGLSARVLVVCTPTSRVIQKDKSIMLPLPFVARLPDDGSDLIISLQPTGKDWCWTIREQVSNYTHVRHVIVPDSVQILDYATLGEASWASFATAGGLVHSMRVYSGVITLDEHVPAAELKPFDNVTVGDTCVDSTGRVWMITGLIDSDVIFGADTGVSFKGPQGEKGTDGAPGKDGTGVTILSSYDSLESLKAEHPTGNAGDAYFVNGHLYVWDTVGSDWKDVGTIQGPKGDKGEPGTNGKDGTNGVNGLGWTYGHGVPTSTGVPVGSLYLDLDTGNVYVFNA